MLYEGRVYSWITGFYWTLTTMSTLGFGDITFDSDLGKFFSVVVLLSGIVFLLVMLPFTFIQFFYAPWLEEQNKGSASDLEVLVKAGIKETPSIIITTHDDNLNIYLAIYCRRLRPDAQIISRASLDRNINTLHRAGANLVMSFCSLVTATIMNLLQPQKMLMLSEGLHVFRTPLSPKHKNKALLDLRICEKTGCSIVAIRRKVQSIINPNPAIVLHKDDELVLIGTAESEKMVADQYTKNI